MSQLQKLRISTALLVGILLAAYWLLTQPPPSTPRPSLPTSQIGSTTKGAILFHQYPCAGCHGITGLGQTAAPPVASMQLSPDQWRREIWYLHYNKHGGLDPFQISETELHHIASWVESLPPPSAEMSREDRFYPLLPAELIPLIAPYLDEQPLRLQGRILFINDTNRFTEVWLRVHSTDNAFIDLMGIYDTSLTKQPFPGKTNDTITLFGIGARPLPLTHPLTKQTQSTPHLQILFTNLDRSN